MQKGGYRIINQNETHFVSFSVVGWIDLFIRQVYKDLFLQSLRYCQLNKGLILNAWCIMTSHVHIIGRVEGGELSAVLRDIKKFTSTRLVAAIRENPNESRKEWMLDHFLEEGNKNSRNTDVQLWQQSNAPIHLYSPWFAMQKLAYLHNNPVKEGWVSRPEDYMYSSAGDYASPQARGLLKIEYLY
jgi:putative transposase